MMTDKNPLMYKFQVMTEEGITYRTGYMMYCNIKPYHDFLLTCHNPLMQSWMQCSDAAQTAAAANKTCLPLLETASHSARSTAGFLYFK